MNYFPTAEHDDECMRSEDPDEECECGAIYQEVAEMRATANRAFAEGRKAGLEEAAQVAESEKHFGSGPEIASAIRALSTKGAAK